ncbi:hypothetical protein [Allostella humosa]|uniref:hypothetical protein n=1 Tax=Stella humosa TaxID=94 RepID=UPI00115210FA|nr:hypothetical protein [Stella humosa]
MAAGQAAATRPAAGRGPPCPAPAALAPAAREPTASAGAVPPGYVRDSADVPANLPEGPDREEIFWFCTACHSSDLVRRQGLTRERWDELLTWMTDRHGMAPLEGTERDKYLDYLSQALPPRRQRGFTNPFLNRE